MENSYAIMNSNLQFLCIEAYKRNHPKLNLHAKSTKPCVWVFKNSDDCKKYINTFSKFKFDDICVFQYENVNEKVYSPEKSFLIHQSVTLSGNLRKKHNLVKSESLINTKLTDMFTDRINDLIYTQNLHIFVPKNIIPNINELSNVNVKIEGVLLEPVLSNLDNDEHLKIIIQNLNNSVIQS